MSKPSENGQDPHSPAHYAWVDLKGGGGQWTPGEKVRIFSDLVGDEINPIEFTALVKLVDQIDGASFLRREWVQLTIEDWSRMLGGVSSRTVKRVKASLLEKELVVERSIKQIPPPKERRLHGNVQAYRPQTPEEREKRRYVRSGSLHVPKNGAATNGAASNGKAPDEAPEEPSEEPSEQEGSTEADQNGQFSPDEFPPWLDEDWEPPTSGGS